MLKPVLDFGKQLLSLARDVQQSKEDIKQLNQEAKEIRKELADLRQEMNQTRLEFAELTRVVERLAFESQRTREKTDAEARLLRLEMENLMLRYGRGLPPADKSAGEGLS